VEAVRELNIIFPDLVGPGLSTRTMNWKDSWAYRVGLEKKFSKLALRAGYYRDKTPQPVENAGPILADNDRDAYSLGFGYGNDRWGVDVSDLYIKFKKPRHRRPLAGQLLRAVTRNRPTSSRSVSGFRSNQGEQK
jgi:long-subunit fatty acid transport protein